MTVKLYALASFEILRHQYYLDPHEALPKWPPT